jgi:hypothetical protein
MESINRLKIQADEIRRKSKKLLALAIMTVAASAFIPKVKAQTFAEWFDQKNTQKMYLLQQIAALHVYATYYKQGNNIAHNGLGSINSLLTSENGLHNAYYNNLKNVSSVVKNNKQVSDIMQWQKDILTRIGNLDKTANLNDNEKKYVVQVKSALFNDCNEQVTELQNLVIDNKLQMSDEERLKHIGVIHKAMQDNYQFASSFANQVKVYAFRRVQENNNVTGEKKIYGIQ